LIAVTFANKVLRGVKVNFAAQISVENKKPGESYNPPSALSHILTVTCCA
jgi:hypothetical protein